MCTYAHTVHTKYTCSSTYQLCLLKKKLKNIRNTIQLGKSLNYQDIYTRDKKNRFSPHINCGEAVKNAEYSELSAFLLDGFETINYFF